MVGELGIRNKLTCALLQQGVELTSAVHDASSLAVGMRGVVVLTVSLPGGSAWT